VSEASVGYIACPACGPTRLQPEQLNRLALDTDAMLRHLFGGIRLAVRPVIADRLWQVGRVAIAARSRDCWFLRGLSTRHHAAILQQLANRPKTIVFTASEAMANTWSQSIDNIVISIESIIDLDATEFQIDLEAMQARILESDGALAPAPKPRPKRATRTAKIERLTNELKMHLRSAADHARSTADQDDGPALLPRPTQEQLGRLAGLSKVDVTRCMKDESANELRLLWQTAGDLPAILRLRSHSIR